MAFLHLSPRKTGVHRIGRYNFRHKSGVLAEAGLLNLGLKFNGLPSRLVGLCPLGPHKFLITGPGLFAVGSVEEIFHELVGLKTLFFGDRLAKAL